MCSPMGAVLAFKGIEGAMTLLHGSQGCATYIRRYLISHFREPLDVASSSFTEHTAIFGGGKNLKSSLMNIVRQYRPRVIGVATTCLSETIGDDVPFLLREFISETEEELPEIVPVSTPSYAGSHAEGFYAAVKAAVEYFNSSPGWSDFSTEQRNKAGISEKRVLNIFSSMVSPEDLRYLKKIIQLFGISGTLFPDYEETLDGGVWSEYMSIPSGGTAPEEIAMTGNAGGSIEFVSSFRPEQTASGWLQDKRDVPAHTMSIPVGVEQTDAFIEKMSDLSGAPIPEELYRSRQRLIDAYTDGHKYIFGKRVLVYGEEELVASLYTFLKEIGACPVVCGSGGSTGLLEKEIASRRDGSEIFETVARGDVDFADIGEIAREQKVELVVGNSKGYKLASALKIPLVRVALPVHDRFGAARIRILGYEGTLELYDRIINALIETRQEESGIGYSYY